MSAAADLLQAAWALAGHLLDEILDARSLRALWVGTLYFGTFVVIGWGGRRLLDRWMSGKGMGVRDSGRLPGQLPRWRFLLGSWRRDD